MNKWLAFAGVSEAATGVALLIAPSLVGQWLFGAELTGIAMTVALLTRASRESSDNAAGARDD